jgi:hypothetical protein
MMPPQDWLRLAQSDETVSRALRVFAQGSVRWSDLYHAFEIVQASVGGRMYDEGWITREQANLFSWTANSPDAVGEQARHGHQRSAPPPNPMVEDEAGEVVRNLVRQWLDGVIAEEP